MGINLNKLKKGELIHLLEAVNEDKIIDTFMKSRTWQKHNNVKCFECENLERKLKGMVEDK